MKSYSQYVCQQCGYQSPSYLGKCPECGEWNSLVESVPDSNENLKFKISNLKFEEKIFKLGDVKSEKINRLATGFSEFDRVLGGGVVKGSIILISGDPGIGKSTLLLQVAMKIARGPVASFPPASARPKPKPHGNQKDYVGLRAVGSPSTRATPRYPTTDLSNYPTILYVTGEESAQQVKIRADRIVRSSGSGQIRPSEKHKPGSLITRMPENLYILPETNVEVVIAASQQLSPSLLVVDSIQTLTTEKLTGSAGSVGQIRECAQILQRLAKSTNVPVFIVGHVTKEGNIAGPKILEHLVDAVLNLEGDDMHAFRILRSSKNRFGSTWEVGVFEMQDSGLVEVDNPSQVFLEQRLGSRAGSVVVATLAGGRPILAEIQALCTATSFPVPTRRVTGLDFARVQIVVASLTKATKLSLGNQDIYVNVAGGLKITEPAADLGAALAVASAVVGKPIREGVCAFGEVGLLGELRPVIGEKIRIAEAKRQGFSDFVTPDKFKTLEDAVTYAIHA